MTHSVMLGEEYCSLGSWIAGQGSMWMRHGSLRMRLKVTWEWD